MDRESSLIRWYSDGYRKENTANANSHVYIYICMPDSLLGTGTSNYRRCSQKEYQEKLARCDG